MLQALRDSLRRLRPLLVVLAVTCAASAGCKKFESWRDGGYTDADAEWGKKYRQKKRGEPDPFFFDEKASQIERSLGL